MNVLQKIGCAAIESLGGGGGISKFFDRQIELMPDYERTLFANKLCVVMPKLTEKFQKIGKYEAWWLTRLVEHRWYSKIRRDELWKSCKVGVNDSNVTVPRLERNLHGVLDKCVPGWKLVSKYEGDDLSVPNVEYYMLGELDDARDAFLGLYPNATWPEVDEEVLAKRREAEALEQEAEEADRANFKRMLATFPEVRHWDDESYAALRLAEKSLEVAKANHMSNREKHGDIKLLKAKHAYDLAKAEDDRCRAAKNARQQVQMKRLEDGLPVYGPDEGPELLVRGDNLG